MILKVTHYGRPRDEFVRIVDKYNYSEDRRLISIDRTILARASITTPITFRCEA